MPPSGIDYKSFELEKAAASAVSRPRSTLGTAAKVVPLLGAIGFAGYLLYTAMPKSPSSMVKKSSEELAGIFGRLMQKSEEKEKSGESEFPFAEITDDDIDNLFS